MEKGSVGSWSAISCDKQIRPLPKEHLILMNDYIIFAFNSPSSVYPRNIFYQVGLHHSKVSIFSYSVSLERKLCKCSLQRMIK